MPPMIDKVARDAIIAAGVVDLDGFFNLIRKNDVAAVEKKLKSTDFKAMGGANLWDDYGTYPIHIAAAEGHIEMLQLLIELKADINQPVESFLRTPLHLAVMNRKHNATKYLIDVGAKTDCKDVFHRAPRSYAVDEDVMRMVYEGELIFENLKDLDQVQGRLWKMNSLAVRKPRVEEAKKICLGYELWKKETEEINLNENLTIPVPGVPGVNLLGDQIYSMRKRNHGQHAYLAEVPLDEMGAGIDYQRPFKSFVHLQYTEYFKGDPAVCIQDIWVQKNQRRHYHGSLLLAAAFNYILRGPHPGRHRIFKVFAVVNEQNKMAVAFFVHAGFVTQPPANIPPRLRQLGTVVFATQHAGVRLNKLTDSLRPALRWDQDWVTSQQLEERRLAEIKKAEDRDMAVFNKRLDTFLKEIQVPRQTKLLSITAGPVCIPLGIAQPPDAARDAEREKVLTILEKRQLSSRLPTDVRERKKEPKFTCENDRVPDEILKKNGQAVLRMRDLHRWKHEIEGKKVGNSRILACPDILRDFWLYELEYDAMLALPDEWVKRKDEDGEVIYFNKETKETTPTRPKRKGTIEKHAVEDNPTLKRAMCDDFAGSVEEKMMMEEEAKKAAVKDRRMWEREMEQVIDKAKEHAESLVSLLRRIGILYEKDTKKKDEITLRAKQAYQAQTKVEGQNLKVEQLEVKKGIFGAVNMFKTPLQKSKEVKNAVQQQCQKLAESKSIISEEAKENSLNRPSSATVSASAFGTPRSQQNAIETPSPSEGNPADQPTRPPKRKSPKRPSTINRCPVDKAAEWIQEAADREQALQDADSMLEIFAPPRSASAPQISTSDELLDTTPEAGQPLSPVIESPVSKNQAAYLGLEGNEDQNMVRAKISPFVRESRPSTAAPHTSSARVLVHGEATTKPAILTRGESALSIASTALHSRGTSRGTVSSTLFGLDGVSRPNSVQQGAGFGVEGFLAPSSEGYRLDGTSALSTPSTSSLFGLEGMSRPSSRGDFRASATTSIFGLEGVSRPSSRAESHPLSREAGSRPISSTMGPRPEWMVPWRMGTGGLSSRSNMSRTSSSSSIFGLDDISRPSSPSRETGLALSKSSIHSFMLDAIAASRSQEAGVTAGAKRREMLPSISIQERPHTVSMKGYRQAVLTKNTRLGEDAANRPQSAAVISPTKKHKHQELHLAQEGREELFHK